MENTASQSPFQLSSLQFACQGFAEFTSPAELEHLTFFPTPQPV